MNKTVNFTQLKAILIDLDGTLVDSMPLLYTTYLHFLKHQGYTGNREEFESLVGATLPEIIAKMAVKYTLKSSSEELLQIYIKMLHKQYREELPLFPVAKDFLLYAKKQHLKLALVTSAPSELVQSFLKGQRLESLFDLVLTSENVRQGKPSPEIFQKALAGFGVSPTNAVVIEDSPKGLEAAAAAGIPAIEFGGMLFKDWHEVLNLFQSHYD